MHGFVDPAQPRGGGPLRPQDLPSLMQPFERPPMHGSVDPAQPSRGGLLPPQEAPGQAPPSERLTRHDIGSFQPSKRPRAPRQPRAPRGRGAASGALRSPTPDLPAYISPIADPPRERTPLIPRPGSPMPQLTRPSSRPRSSRGRMPYDAALYDPNEVALNNPSRRASPAPFQQRSVSRQRPQERGRSRSKSPSPLFGIDEPWARGRSTSRQPLTMDYP